LRSPHLGLAEGGVEVTETTRVSSAAKPHYVARTVHSTGEGRHGMLRWAGGSAEAEWKPFRLLESSTVWKRGRREV